MAEQLYCRTPLKKIVTKGDRILDVPLAKIGGKGLFTKEIEQELLDGTIDLAVHSLKDMPTVLPEGLCLTAITERANAGDAFVSNKYNSAQLLARRPDLKIVDLRGNVDTRLKKLDEGQMDAIILAAAGLTRLGHADRIKEIIPQSYCLPAVGQGALAIECRTDNFKVRQMLDFLNDTATKQATDAERARRRTRLSGPARRRLPGAYRRARRSKRRAHCHGSSYCFSGRQHRAARHRRRQCSRRRNFRARTRTKNA